MIGVVLTGLLGDGASGLLAVHIYFPETAVISLVSTLSNGAAVEVGTVGSEGMVGLSVFLAKDVSFVQTYTQIPGVIWRMDAATFTQLASAPGALHGMLHRYTQAFLAQVSQTAVCNATHLVEERCARCLLMTHDRMEGDTFPLTHEFLAFMLGVRRAGVTVAVRALQDAGIVQYSRGRVELIDRAAAPAPRNRILSLTREAMRRRHENGGPQADLTPNPDGEAELLPDLLRRALSGLLGQRWPNEPDGDLRLALRDACDRARNDGLRAEELLLVLKDAWRELPERRGLPRVDPDEALARVVTACIDEFYHSPRREWQLGERRVFHSEASGRTDSQNAEIH